MNKDNLSLTIVIPTYNRHELLLSQLNVLLTEVSSNVKCVVIDNNSTPSVKSYLQECKLDINQLVVIENNINIGADRNIYKSYFFPEKGWVWVLSDDDFIKPGIISQVLNDINENNSVFWINYCSQYCGSQKYCGYKNFCNEVVYWASFSISNIIYNVDVIRGYQWYYENYIWTMQAPLLLASKIISENPYLTFQLNSRNLFVNNCPTVWQKMKFIDSTILLILYTFSKF